MGRISATFSVSLPPEMVEELERLRKREHRTRSELVREALRQYMGSSAQLRLLRQQIARLPEDEATAEEIEAIKESRGQFREGKFITIDQLRHGMDRRAQPPRRKKSRSRARR